MYETINGQPDLAYTPHGQGLALNGTKPPVKAKTLNVG